MIKQINGESSVQTKNIDAGGNVIINNGVQYNEIKKLFLDLFDANFPKLLEESYKKAFENINNILELLKAKMEVTELKIDKLKLSTPDIHYTLNEAITVVGRKGNEVDTNLLCELLMEKMEKNKGEYELLLDESLKVVPKLNKSYLEFLSTIVMLYTYICFNGETASDIEKSYNQIFSKFPTNLNLSNANVSYLTSLGLIRLRPYRVRSINTVTSKHILRNDIFKNQFKENFNLDIEKEKLLMPNIYEFYNRIGEKLDIELYEPTALGNLVGAIYFQNFIRKIFPKFDVETKSLI